MIAVTVCGRKTYISVSHIVSVEPCNKDSSKILLSTGDIIIALENVESVIRMIYER